jgi:DNA-binding XRE family transcriptional regulator
MTLRNFRFPLPRVLQEGFCKHGRNTLACNFCRDEHRNAIRLRRVELGLTVGDVARRCGVTINFYMALENGNTRLTKHFYNNQLRRVLQLPTWRVFSHEPTAEDQSAE